MPETRQAPTLNQGELLRESAATGLLRVLQVEDDALDAMLVEHYLRKELPCGYELDRVDSLQSAVQRLERQEYDAILLDLTLPDSAGLETLKRVARRNRSIPILVLSGDEDPDKANQAIGEGAHDFLFKSRLDGGFLSDALQRAVSEGDACGPIDAKVCQPFSRHDERRGEPRFTLSGSVVVFPILPDGSPGPEIGATAVDISSGGIGVIAEVDVALTDACLVGLERPDGSFAYATVRWTHRRAGPEGFRLGGAFVSGREDPLDPSKLTPRLNTTTLRLRPSIRETVLNQWAQRGVARPYVIDRVMVCPSCQAMPTYRMGCPKCGSARAASSRLIHHFACAHVAHATAFQQGDTLVCPKCRARNLVVGADFEHLDGATDCGDCEWSGSELVQIGECLRCGLRFPGTEARDLEVIQFHVERLDPLAVIEAR